MESAVENKTVETPNEVVNTTESKAPTRSELKEKGWGASELDAAEKRGMIQKKEKKEPVLEVVSDAKEEPKTEVSQDGEEKPKEEKKPVSSLPDFTINDPAKEKVFLDTFGAGTPQRAMYFRMKNERQARQSAEAKMRQLEEEIQLLKGRKAEPKIETDADGNEIDPDDKPLTPKMLREMQQKEAEERQKQDQELRGRAERVSTAIKDQEEYARSVYSDFDDTCKLAHEVMQNLESLIPEKWKRDEAIELMQQLRARAERADEFEIDALTPAMVAYKLGSLHPNKGKTNGTKAETHNDGNLDRPETKANGSLTPEQMKRAEQNNQRRTSSASIPASGGKRSVSPDEVSPAELNKMSLSERMSFREKHPAQYAKLLRG